MKGFKKRKFEIETLSRSYIESKRIIKEAQENIIHPSREKLEACNLIVRHIDNVVESLDENDQFIIHKEVIEGKRGNWYLDYFSSTSYYRQRDKAYDNFLRCL